VLRPRDLPLLAVFAAVARRGSFTAAAKELGLSKTVVSDNVRALEERCGVRLIERSTRQMRLTQVGEQVLQAASGVADAAREIDTILEEHRDAAVGTLRIATTHDLTPRLVMPVASRLARSHPKLRLEVHSDDAIHDLIAEQFDLAVRLGAPRDSAQVIRKLGYDVERIAAVPALADAFGEVTRPQQLAAAPWVRHAVVTRDTAWRFRGPRGQLDQLAPTIRGEANTGDGVRALLLGGVGFGVMPNYMIADELARGTLVTVCPQWVWRRLTLYALLPSKQRQPKRVGLFLDAVKAELATAMGRDIHASASAAEPTVGADA
jgi:molybdate transport repressor ModE-like protein